MKLIISTEEELQEIISRTLEKTFKSLMPNAIRLASEKEWFRTDELMKYLGCSRRHIQHLRDSRRIPFHQEGRTIRYHINDIKEYMKKNRIDVWER